MKNKLQKKADSPPAYLIGLIIFLILLAVFLPIYYQFKNKLAEGTISEIRQQNVKKHAEAHMTGFDFSTELVFPIIRKTVKKGEEIKESSKALAQDWTDLFKGEKQLFPIEEGEEIVYCVPGHYLEFKDKNKKIPAGEYAKYQKETTVGELGVKGIIGDPKTPISEYLTGYTTDKEVFEEEMKQLREQLANREGVSFVDEEDFYKGEFQKYAINTQIDYTTVFIYMKKGYWGKWISSIFGTNIGIVGGAVVGLILIPFTGGGSIVVTAVALTGGTTGGIIGFMTASSKRSDWDTGIFLVPNKAEILKDLKCDVLPAKGEIE